MILHENEIIFPGFTEILVKIIKLFYRLNSTFIKKIWIEEWMSESVDQVFGPTIYTDCGLRGKSLTVIQIRRFWNNPFSSFWILSFCSSRFACYLWLQTNPSNREPIANNYASSYTCHLPRLQSLSPSLTPKQNNYYSIINQLIWLSINLATFELYWNSSR